jgi:hypothetical protein
MFSLVFPCSAPYRLSQVHTVFTDPARAVTLRVFAFRIIDRRSVA